MAKKKIKRTSLKEKEDITEKIRENPWILSTFIFGIFILVFLAAYISEKGSNNSSVAEGDISEEDAGKIILNFVALQTGEEAELVAVNSFGNSLYEVTVLFRQQEIPIYLTKDGKNLIQGVIPLDEFMQAVQEAQQVQIEETEEDINKTEENSTITKTYYRN